MVSHTYCTQKSSNKVVLTSTCQATRPLQGCVGIELVGNLVGLCPDVVQHSLGGRQGGVASHG